MSKLLALSNRLPPRARRLLKRLPAADRLRRIGLASPGAAGPRSGEPRAVVYLPTWARWDVMRQRPQYLLEAFAAAGHPVYFVDPRTSATEVRDGVTIVPDLRSVPGSGVILYVHFAPLQVLFDRFDDPVVVYDLLDDLSIYDADEQGMPNERRVASHHPAVVSRADVMLVSNPTLQERHSGERSDLVLVENGVDLDRFRTPASKPADLPDGNRPIVGYHGAVAPWLDFELLAETIAALPDHDFVFVGPVDGRAAEAVAALGRLPNVHLLGERSPDDMPAYVQAFDVSIVPFVVDDMTAGVSPLKMYESLATGTPVVATELPSCLDEPAVLTAAGPAGFSAGIVAAADSAGDREWAAQADRSASAADWGNRLLPVLDRLDRDGLRSVL